MEMNNSFGFMLPKRSAITAMHGATAFPLHMIPDRSKYKYFSMLPNSNLCKYYIFFRNFPKYVFGFGLSVLQTYQHFVSTPGRAGTY